MKLLQVSYTLFLFNCSETLHNKWFSCLVPADVTYYTSWRNIRGNDTFRCAKSDIPSGGSRFESPSTHSQALFKFSQFLPEAVETAAAIVLGSSLSKFVSVFLEITLPINVLFCNLCSCYSVVKQKY